jgi:hypothetical protein
MACDEFPLLRNGEGKAWRLMAGTNIPFLLAFGSIASEVWLALLLLWDFSLSFSACFACLYERLGRCRATARTVFVFKVSMCSLLCFALFHRLSSRCSVGSKDACMNDTSPRAQAMLPLSGGD